MGNTGACPEDEGELARVKGELARVKGENADLKHQIADSGASRTTGQERKMSEDAVPLMLRGLEVSTAVERSLVKAAKGNNTVQHVICDASAPRN